MNETVINVVSDIMDSFDLSEIHDLLSVQINNPNEDYTSPVIDHFQPLYRNYMLLNEMTEEDQEDVQIVRERFHKICRMIIELIENKFNVGIDEEYLADDEKDLPGICLALYSFFILDFYNNIYEILKNYLVENLIKLYETFAENSSKKDAVSASNRKQFSNEMTIIASNIYDITDYEFTLLDAESALKYLDEGYIPSTIITSLYNRTYMSGDFVRVFADIYKTNTPLKSKVCFDILYKIKDGAIEDIFRIFKEEE